MFNSPFRKGMSVTPRVLGDKNKEKMSAPNNAFYVLTQAHLGLPNSVLTSAINVGDFINDVGYLTTVDISGDTNLAVTSPITLTDDTVSFDFSVGNTWTGNQLFGTTTELQFRNATTFMSSPSDDELRFSANTGLSPFVSFHSGEKERFRFGVSEAVINDGGELYDFRIEGNTEANLFFTDASEDRVGIGTNTPDKLFQVAGDGHVDGDLLVDGEVQGSRENFHYGDSASRTASLYLKSISNVTMSADKGYRMLRAGSITGHSTLLEIELATSGDVTFEVRINDSNQASLENEFSFALGTGFTSASVTVARGTVTFSAGDIIQIRGTETGVMGWDDVIGYVEVAFDS